MAAVILKYWKPLALAALLAALIGGVWGYGRARYNEGWQAAETQLHARQTEALAKRTAETLAKERHQAAELAAAQAEIEKERENAKTAVNHLRGELDRVRAYAAARSRTVSATAPTPGTADEAAAKGWQLFGRCAAEYAGMAEIADNQRNDLAEWQAYARVAAPAAE